jgi:hypothetical protein
VKYFAVFASIISLSLMGCRTTQPLNPPQLVTDSSTDMAIQLFMQATILLANYYGYKTISYDVIEEKSARAGYATLPFMPPIAARATPKLINLTIPSYQDTAVFRDQINSSLGYNNLVRYYITTGTKAAEIICKNYMLGLAEKNQYLEFLRDEFGVAYNLATGVLLAVNANGTLSNAFSLARGATDSFVTTYEDYRYLHIVDREAARILVMTAQEKYMAYFLNQIDQREKNKNMGAGSVAVTSYYTFSEALNAVSTIEYPCTREGIANLVNRAVNNTPTNLDIDVNTGSIIFKSNAPAPGGSGNNPNPPTGTQSLDAAIKKSQADNIRSAVARRQSLPSDGLGNPNAKNPTGDMQAQPIPPIPPKKPLRSGSAQEPGRTEAF